MKVLSTEGLTKLIQLIKSSFISVNNTVTTNTVTLAAVATSGDFDDLINQPTTPDTSNLADKDLSNLSSTGDIKMAGASMPSNKYIDLTLGASGTTYTAPANGYYNIGYQAQNDCYVTLWSSRLEASQWQQGNWAALFLPVKKGQQVVLDYKNMTLRYFRFTYAVGSESEAS